MLNVFSSEDLRNKSSQVKSSLFFSIAEYKKTAKLHNTKSMQ